MPRKSSFEINRILHDAMMVFWEKGYLGTSMRDLVRATSLHPGSLYHSFGNKKKLFLEVTDFYYRQLTANINSSLMGKSSADRILRDFFESFTIKREHGVRGCLLVNSLLESSDDVDIQVHISAMFTGFEEMFYWILVKGVKEKTFDHRLDCRRMAKALVNDYYGLRVQSLTELPGEEFKELIQFRLQQLHQ